MAANGACTSSSSLITLDMDSNKRLPLLNDTPSKKRKIPPSNTDDGSSSNNPSPSGVLSSNNTSRSKSPYLSKYKEIIRSSERAPTVSADLLKLLPSIDPLNLLLEGTLSFIPKAIISLIIAYISREESAGYLLHASVLCRNERQIHEILNAYPNSIDFIKPTDTYCFTPLHIAAIINDKKIIQLLLARGAHPYIAEGRKLMLQEALDHIHSSGDEELRLTALWVAQDVNEYITITDGEHDEIIKIFKGDIGLDYYDPKKRSLKKSQKHDATIHKLL